MKSDAEMLAQFEEAVAHFEAKPDGPARNALATIIYRPDARLAPLLTELHVYIVNPPQTHEQRQAAGKLLEQIATVAFDCVRGRSVIKSFRSPEDQHDLYVNGAPPAWDPFWRFTRLPLGIGGVLVECKATNSRVGSPVFARLCHVLSYGFCNTAVLGVFFTLLGASGFPEPNKPRQQKLGDARLRQVLFYASEKKPIVVFDKADILSLAEPGSLVILIERKVRDIEELSGLPAGPDEHALEVDLPDHLSAMLAGGEPPGIDSL